MNSNHGQRFWEQAAPALGCALLLLAALSVPAALRLRVDNRIERWVEPQGAEARNYRDFQKHFGSDEFVLAVYDGQPIFGEAALDAQLAALKKLEAVNGVLSVSGMPAVFRDRFGAEDPEAFQADALATPFYKGFLLSDDAAAAGLLIQTAAEPESAGRRTLVEAVRAALQPLRDFGYQVHAVGPPLLNAELDATSQKEGRRVFPWAVALSAAVLWALFRSLRAALAAMVCSATSVVLSLELMSALGYSLNMVSSAFPPLLWVISLTNSIHILRRYQIHCGKGRSCDDAARQARRESALPCGLAAFTTAAGFFSLVTAHMIPVRELGCLSAAGIALSLLVNLTVCPLLIGWLKIPGLSPRNTPPAFDFERLLPFYEQWKRVLLASALAVLLLAMAAVPWIRAESDPLSFLPNDSAIRGDHAAVAASLAGFYSLELVVNTGGSWLEPAAWKPLETLAETIAQQPGVARVLSPLDLLKKLNQWAHDFEPAHYALPESAVAARGLLDQLDAQARRECARLVSEDGGTVRLSALVNVMDSTRFMRIVEEAERALNELPAPLSGYRTGIVLQLVQSQLALVDAQVKSIGFAFVTIFLCIFAGLRSWRLTLASMLPNVLPIAAVLAAMAIGGIALDAATVMVAGIALGIAVDDTIHLLSEFQRERAGGATPQQAVTTALQHTGPAMLIATLSSCTGFFALLGSHFVPIGWFGLLSGLALLVALGVELLVTPALLLFLGQKTWR